MGAALGCRKLAELLDGLRPCFARTEPWLQAGKYAAAVTSDLRRWNGWTIAERSGDRTLDRTQRLLNRAVWDTFAAMGVVRRFAAAGLDEAVRRTGRPRGLTVGRSTKPGQVKAGARTAGVKRQYLGCVGKVANGIDTVHLSYVREGTGHALIGARVGAKRGWQPVCCLGSPEARRCGSRGCSAAGSAPPWHGGGQGFESPQLHQICRSEPVSRSWTEDDYVDAVEQSGLAVITIDYPRPHDPAAWSSDEASIPPCIVIQARKARGPVT